jgi:hypothetical protein
MSLLGVRRSLISHAYPLYLKLADAGTVATEPFKEEGS